VPKYTFKHLSDEIVREAPKNTNGEKVCQAEIPLLKYEVQGGPDTPIDFVLGNPG